MTLGSPLTSNVTGQVKVGMFDFFGLDDIGEPKFDVKGTNPPLKKSLNIPEIYAK